MKNFNILCFLMVVMMAFTSCQQQSTETTETPGLPQFDDQWAKNKLWDDGLAEVAIYDAKRVVYGESRSFDYVYVAVKEVFNEAYQVKTDDYNRPDLFDVIKVNKFADIPTDNYPYHYLTSVFFKRDALQNVHKLTNSSQEWCGLTTKSFLNDQNNYRFEWISYWDGQGNGSSTIKNAWFEDQISYSLRSLKFESGLSFTIDLYPSQVTSKASKPEAQKATILVEVANEKDSLLQAYDKVWRVEVTYQSSGNQINFWYADAYPNYMLKMEAWDGRTLYLKDLSRYAYWKNRN